VFGYRVPFAIVETFREKNRQEVMEYYWTRTSILPGLAAGIEACYCSREQEERLLFHRSCQKTKTFAVFFGQYQETAPVAIILGFWNRPEVDALSTADEPSRQQWLRPIWRRLHSLKPFTTFQAQSFP
jgi:hypothetical protein